MGLLRSTEDCCPLVLTRTPRKNKLINEDVYSDLEHIISNKFGDSCRQSLTSVKLDGIERNLEFEFKKSLMRETSSANSSPKKFPVTIKRTDSFNLNEDTELKSASWYQAGLPREISLEVLAEQNPGAFLVRKSSTKPGCFALSVRIPSGTNGPKVSHYLILRTSRGYKIKVSLPDCGDLIVS